MDTMEFVRGDANYHTFSMEATAWTAGGRLFFAAKQQIDDDSTDAAALIQGAWADTDVIDETINGVAYKTYKCTFPPSATNSIESDGAVKLDLLGEFQYVPLNGYPSTFPYNDSKIPVAVYFDVKRKTTV